MNIVMDMDITMNNTEYVNVYMLMYTDMNINRNMNVSTSMNMDKNLITNMELWTKDMDRGRHKTEMRIDKEMETDVQHEHER